MCKKSGKMSTAPGTKSLSASMSAAPLEITFGARLSDALSTPEDFRKSRRKLNKSLAHYRRDLNMVERDTVNYRKKKAAAGLPTAHQFSDARYCNYYLLLVERYTLHALELKALLEYGVDQKTWCKKVMGRKLTKAVHIERSLIGAVKEQPFSARLVELYVHAALTEGFTAVYKKRWATAVHAYSLARCGLEFLQKTNDSNALNASLYAELVEELVDPSLRLAATQEGNTATYDLRSVAKAHSSDNHLPHLTPLVELITANDAYFFATPEGSELCKTITWRDHQAHIDNDELAFSVAKLQDVIKEGCDMSDLFSLWLALVDLHQTDLAKNKNEDDPEKVQNDAIILTFLKYNACFSKLKRDLQMIESSADSSVISAIEKLRRSLQLYTAAIETVDEIKDLPGVYNDEDLSESLDSLSKLLKTKHSVTVARVYAHTGKFAEALAIYAHLKDSFLVNDAFFKVKELPYEVASLQDARELQQYISDTLVETHLLAQFHRENTQNTYVVDDVYKFCSVEQSRKKLVNVGAKAKISPITSKAVLFDIAFNYINYSQETNEAIPSSEARTSETNDSSHGKKKSGFFGIFGR